MRSYTSGQSIQFSATSNNISTGSYQTLTNATPGYPSGKIQYYNSTGQILVLAYGLAGSEQILLSLPPNTNMPIVIELIIPNNVRLALKAVDGVANSGFLTLDIFI